MTRPWSVGVVIPVYNRASMVADALGSVLGQTHPVDQVVVVDDGSTDDTVAVVRKLASDDSRVIILEQENAGPSAARNRGLRRLETDLVAFLDSDDLMEPGQIRFQIDYLRRNPEVDAVFGCMRIELVPGIEPPSHIVNETKIRGPHYCTQTMLIRRAQVLAVGGYAEDLRISEDTDLMIRLKANGLAVAKSEEVMIRRRVMGDNLSYGFAPDDRTMLGLLRRHRTAQRDTGSE